MVVQPFLDEEAAEQGCYEDRHYERNRQCDGYCDGERHDKLADRACDDQERQERGDDRDGRSKDRDEDVARTPPGRFLLGYLVV